LIFLGIRGGLREKGKGKSTSVCEEPVLGGIAESTRVYQEQNQQEYIRSTINHRVLLTQSIVKKKSNQLSINHDPMPHRIMSSLQKPTFVLLGRLMAAILLVLGPLPTITFSDEHLSGPTFSDEHLNTVHLAFHLPFHLPFQPATALKMNYFNLNWWCCTNDNTKGRVQTRVESWKQMGGRKSTCGGEKGEKGKKKGKRRGKIISRKIISRVTV
jgi:hypothetical protein